ncbi:hypothetical protein NDU88_004828 [Pleurodeles waltl]|uniref:Uncharacterized protein n=1 Tax=Pleurodeles waltl TaxID=8319 RepID=A0AAV7QDT8_PLEWA|nr:hypothetical protein NDU88_004828 [Pleurodeles waltl]
MVPRRHDRENSHRRKIIGPGNPGPRHGSKKGGGTRVVASQQLRGSLTDGDRVERNVRSRRRNRVLRILRLRGLD